jgi:hypothetical protein
MKPCIRDTMSESTTGSRCLPIEPKKKKKKLPTMEIQTRGSKRDKDHMWEPNQKCGVDKYLQTNESN